MELIANVKPLKVGDSLYVLLPANVAKVLQIEKSTMLNIFKDGDRLVYEKSKS